MIEDLLEEIQDRVTVPRYRLSPLGPCAKTIQSRAQIAGIPEIAAEAIRAKNIPSED
jgi:hypothetical protein